MQALPLNYVSEYFEESKTFRTPWRDDDPVAFKHLDRWLSEGQRVQLPKSGHIFRDPSDVVSVLLSENEAANFALPFPVTILEYEMQPSDRHFLRASDPTKDRITLLVDYPALGKEDPAGARDFIAEFGVHQEEVDLMDRMGGFLTTSLFKNDKWRLSIALSMTPRFQGAFDKVVRRKASTFYLAFIKSVIGTMPAELLPGLHQHWRYELSQDLISAGEISRVCNIQGVKFVDLPCPALEAVNQQRKKEGLKPFLGYKTYQLPRR